VLFDGAGRGVGRWEDPRVIRAGGKRIGLVPGDAVGTADPTSMPFRAQVRDREWQQQFLGMPLAQRKAIIAGLREGSREAQAGKSYEIMDVAPEAVEKLYEQTEATIIIHGHTHRPAVHDTGGKLRYVLPDWELDAEPRRGGWIELGHDGTLTQHGLS